MMELADVGWTWYPSIFVGFSAWTLGYAWFMKAYAPGRIGRQLLFHTGTFLAIFALMSPLDALGDEYLFSAHMVQHLLLVFGTSPLWLLGIPPELLERISGQNVIATIRWMTRPTITFLVFVGVLYLWHIPFFYGLALDYEIVHVVEHLSFIGAAILGWWPIAAPETDQLPKLDVPAGMIYLFLLAIPCTGIAAVFTFAKSPIYDFYLDAPRIARLSVVQDLNLGGLFMWLPTHMVILFALCLLFLKWFSSMERRARYDRYSTAA